MGYQTRRIRSGMYRRAIGGLIRKYGGRKVRAAMRTVTRTPRRTRRVSRRPLVSRRIRRSYRRTAKRRTDPADYVKVKINHRRGVTYEKNEIMDVYRTSGAGYVASQQNQQAWNSKMLFAGDSTAYTSRTGGTIISDPTSLQAFMTAFGLGTATATNRKIRSTYLKMRMVSASNNLLKLDLYVVKANKDTASNMYQACKPNWTLEEASEKTSAMNITNPGVTPYMYPQFGAYWRIIKKKSYTLNPGQAVVLNVQTNEHWHYNNAKIGYQMETSDFHTMVKGRTYGVLLCVQGFPQSMTTTTTPATTVVGISPAKVHYTWEFCIKSSTLIHPGRSNFVAGNELDPLTDMANGQVINDDAGTAMQADIAGD